MSNSFIKGLVLVCSFLLGIGLLVELDPNDDMSLFATLAAIVVITYGNVKMFDDKKMNN